MWKKFFLFYDVLLKLFYEVVSLRLSACIFNAFDKILHEVKCAIKFSERIFFFDGISEAINSKKN